MATQASASAPEAAPRLAAVLDEPTGTLSLQLRVAQFVALTSPHRGELHERGYERTFARHRKVAFDTLHELRGRGCERPVRARRTPWWRRSARRLRALVVAVKAATLAAAAALVWLSGEWRTLRLVPPFMAYALLTSWVNAKPRGSALWRRALRHASEYLALCVLVMASFRFELYGHGFCRRLGVLMACTVALTYVLFWHGPTPPEHDARRVEFPRAVSVSTRDGLFRTHGFLADSWAHPLSEELTFRALSSRRYAGAHELHRVEVQRGALLEASYISLDSARMAAEMAAALNDSLRCWREQHGGLSREDTPR